MCAARTSRSIRIAVGAIARLSFSVMGFSAARTRSTSPLRTRSIIVRLCRSNPRSQTRGLRTRASSPRDEPGRQDVLARSSGTRIFAPPGTGAAVRVSGEGDAVLDLARLHSRAAFDQVDHALVDQLARLHQPRIHLHQRLDPKRKLAVEVRGLRKVVSNAPLRAEKHQRSARTLARHARGPCELVDAHRRSPTEMADDLFAVSLGAA